MRRMRENHCTCSAKLIYCLNQCFAKRFFAFIHLHRNADLRRGDHHDSRHRDIAQRISFQQAAYMSIHRSAKVQAGIARIASEDTYSSWRSNTPTSWIFSLHFWLDDVSPL